MKLENLCPLESKVNYYRQAFPAVFSKARGARIWDEAGKAYIDFFSGAGALNYGHNNVYLRKKLIEYLESDGIVHSLDMATTAKEKFMKIFEQLILQPRHMNYVLQFTGPTGTNAVEAALKLARKIKNRSNIISFTNGFHGVTAGALAATGNAHFRRSAGINLGNVSFMPYDGYFGDGVDTIHYLERMLDDRSSGIDAPAAVIIETTQGEGGVHVARTEWLQALANCCKQRDILLIVDDIQVGCGRTGNFFSFEEAGIEPDIIVLSKSLSGFGLPLSLVLLKPELDVWEPGQHNGTFRGNNLAFVTATHALQSFWVNDGLCEFVRKMEAVILTWFTNMSTHHPHIKMQLRGKGLIYGLSITGVGDVDLSHFNSITEDKLHRRIARCAFENGLIIETAGAESDVLKILPPLLIDENFLRQGLDMLEKSIVQALHTILKKNSEDGQYAFPELSKI